MSDRFPEQMLQAGDQNLDPIPGAKLNFYITGTSTRKDTYSDAAKTIPNTNPVVADLEGRFGDILMDTDIGYKVVYTDAADVVIQTFDPYSPVRTNPIAQIPVVTKSSDFSVLDTENGTWFNVDASSGPVTATLPPIADAGNGFHVYIKKIDTSSNVVTVDGDGAETIDGSPTFPLSNQNDTILVDANATAWYAFIPVQETPFSAGHLTGLTLSSDAGDTANDINVTAGKARDGDDTENITLATEITKQIDVAWSVGDDAGGLDTGVVADNTWYHLWLIKRTDTGVVDALFSLSATAPTMPANYDKKRRVGSVRRATATNLAFSQNGDEFLWDIIILDYSVNNPGISGVLRVLTVPTGVQVNAIHSVTLQLTDLLADTAMLIMSPDQSNTNPSLTRHSLVVRGAAGVENTSSITIYPRTDISAQIRTRLSASDGTTDIFGTTFGWIDRRGRD